jgi:hypothetical protein
VKLLNGEKAIIPPAKIEGYCLSFESERGKHKARVFKSVLGIEIENAQILYDALQFAATQNDAQFEETNEFGDKYIIDFELETQIGIGIIRSSWIISHNADIPR